MREFVALLTEMVGRDAAALSRRMALVVLGIALPALSAAPVAADTWYEHYASAENALQDGQWRAAIDQINSALEKKGDSGVRVRTYGMKFTTYFPYLKLGIAYYELGELEAALQAFETEERLGEIAGSPRNLEELRRYRDLANEAQRAVDQAEADRIAGIVEDSLEEAERLEREGHIDDAIATLGSALAVSPSDSEALTLLDRLRTEMARRQEEADLAARRSALIDRGRAELQAGNVAAAASVFRQALALGESPEARRLFDRAQQRLSEELEDIESSERELTVTRTLSEVAELESSGRLEEALDRMQSVLVLDPGNPVVVAVETRLLAARDEAERIRQRQQLVAGFLAETEAALAGGDLSRAMATANRILGIDPANDRALALLASAYRIVSGQLLGGSTGENVPPAVSFVDSRQERGDGTLAQIVGEAEFVLRGLVIDDSPVEIEFSDAAGREIDGALRGRQLGELSVTEFQVASRLAPGLNIFRLVARDTDGLTSSSEYAVIYRRSVVRSPWMAAVVTAMAALLIGTVLAQRRRRLRRLRERRFNPYMAGSPVMDESLFFGRGQLLDRILQTLHNNSLLLHGERRIGKTTLQHQLKRRLEELQDPDFVFYPVFIDLQGTPESRFFATLAEEIFDELEPALDGLEPGTSPAGEYVYRDFVKDLRQVLRRLRDRDSRQARLVLLIDEVDELNSYDPRVNQRLRSLFMKSFAENLVAVVSGVTIKREWDREGSPWYNFFEEIDVGPIRPEDARELIERPVRGVLSIDEAAVDRILETTGCRPYRIQKLCMSLVNHVYEQGRRRITLADVEAVGSSEETVAA